MKKKTKQKQQKRKTLDLHSWVKPITQARYWADMIGEVVQLRPQRNGPFRVYRIRFQYKKDGTRLPKTEEFDFPVNRLVVVPDFRARIANKNMLPEKKPSNDLFDAFECEEVPTVGDLASLPPAPAPVANNRLGLAKGHCLGGPWNGKDMVTTESSDHIFYKAGIPFQYMLVEGQRHEGLRVFKWNGPDDYADA